MPLFDGCKVRWLVIRPSTKKVPYFNHLFAPDVYPLLTNLLLSISLSERLTDNSFFSLTPEWVRNDEGRTPQPAILAVGPDLTASFTDCLLRFRPATVSHRKGESAINSVQQFPFPGDSHPNSSTRVFRQSMERWHAVAQGNSSAQGNQT